MKFRPARGTKNHKRDKIPPGRDYDWELDPKKKTRNQDKIPPGRPLWCSITQSASGTHLETWFGSAWPLRFPAVLKHFQGGWQIPTKVPNGGRRPLGTGSGRGVREKWSGVRKLWSNIFRAHPTKVCAHLTPPFCTPNQSLRTPHATLLTPPILTPPHGPRDDSVRGGSPT